MPNATRFNSTVHKRTRRLSDPNFVRQRISVPYTETSQVLVVSPYITNQKWNLVRIWITSKCNNNRKEMNHIQNINNIDMRNNYAK